MNFIAGKCYELSFNDGQIIRFKMLTVEANTVPLVEVDGQQHNLHVLMSGHSIVGQREIPCDQVRPGIESGVIPDAAARTRT